MSEDQREAIRQSHLNLNRKMSDESRRKLSEAKRGVPRDEATKQKIRESLAGTTRPQEVKDKIKATKAANPYRHTQATKDLISQKLRNKYGN